ncbi:MAG: NAD(P)-dependent glycerol-3-phosphate dehydrogenase [Nitrosomonadales bacterium]|nr:NAD(P)-dependent glycerol-3-phosphate dehydrogenase [Nitrosomonadales bacterium]
MNITVLGAGAWGTALAISLSASHRVTLWARDVEQIEAMRGTRENKHYLPDIALPPNLELSSNFPVACSGAELVIIAVPTAALRSILLQLVQPPRPAVGGRLSVLWLCKGFEAESAKLPHQVVAEVLPEGCQYGVLSGPSFAQEVARGFPTALTLASADEEFARSAAHALHHAYLRIYTSSDMVGVEVGGAVKNVMAIAAGICDGMGLGHNARAALLTRGLAEITRLGLKLGGRSETLSGLSGVGDLILTCTGDLSRNRQVGLLLAQQHDLAEILRRLGHVAEGVYTVREVHRIAQRLGVAMPICEAVYRILYEQVPAAEMVAELLNRTPHSEFEDV